MRIYQVWLWSLALALSACGGSSSSDAVNDQTEPDTDEFRIVDRSPAVNADNVVLHTPIIIQFSDVLIDASVSAETIVITGDNSTVATELHYETGSQTVTITPVDSLAFATRYRVSVSSELMADDGRSFPGESWEFVTAGNLGSTSQAVIDECMSEVDIEMLSQVNAARSRARNCGDQQRAAVAPIAWHCTIESAALAHSTDMASLNYFSHTGSDGSSVGDRLTNAGYRWRRAGENIAAGQTSVAQVMAAWLDSPGHCLNIMDADVTEMGAALVETMDADYSHYWTQNFAQPQ